MSRITKLIRQLFFGMTLAKLTANASSKLSNGSSSPIFAQIEKTCWPKAFSAGPATRSRLRPAATVGTRAATHLCFIWVTLVRLGSIKKTLSLWPKKLPRDNLLEVSIDKGDQVEVYTLNGYALSLGSGKPVEGVALANTRLSIKPP